MFRFYIIKQLRMCGQGLRRERLQPQQHRASMRQPNIRVRSEMIPLNLRKSKKIKERREQVKNCEGLNAVRGEKMKYQRTEIERGKKNPSCAETVNWLQFNPTVPRSDGFLTKKKRRVLISDHFKI